MKKFSNLMRITIFTLVGVLFSGFGNPIDVNAKTTGNDVIQGITANCYVSEGGRAVRTFEIKVSNTASYLSLTAADFTIENAVIDLGVPNNVKVTNVTFTKNTIILAVDFFHFAMSDGKQKIADYSKYPEITYKDGPAMLKITCNKYKKLSFTYNDITKIKTETLDSFKSGSYNGLEYKLYSPKTTNDKPLPLVMYNHGGGTTVSGNQLLDDPFAVSFAIDDVQEAYPCYVFAPFRAPYSGTAGTDSQEYKDYYKKQLANEKAVIDQLIATGKVDPKRIYISGESMGCIASFDFMDMFPGFVTAAVAMDGGPLDYDEATDSVTKDSYATDAKLQKIVDNNTKVMILQPIGDPMSLVKRLAYVYKSLIRLGADKDQVIWHSYTAEEVDYLVHDDNSNAYLGKDPVVDPITGRTSVTGGYFHNGSRPASNDTFVKMWLFDQTK